MSLLGKILALLNIFGAIGLVCVASMDYAKRQSWAYAYTRHNLQIDGLPADEDEPDEDLVPLVFKISDDTRNQLFSSVGGQGVATQKEEVANLRNKIKGKLDALAQKKAQQSHLLARVLLALADSYAERDQLLACRVHLASDDSVKALETRCRKALERALEPVTSANPDIPVPTLHEVFRREFRAQTGDPAESFVTLLLRDVPDDRAKAAAETKPKFDGIFAAAIEKQRATLEKRLASVFEEALGNSPDPANPGKRPARENQKFAIARLLFGLAPYLAEDAILTDNGKQAERQTLEKAVSLGKYQENLVESATYKKQVERVLVVCGLRHTLLAITDRTTGLRRLLDYAGAVAAQERQQFIFDHGVLVDQAREQATLARAELALKNENMDRLTALKAVVAARSDEIDRLKDEYKKSRADTLAEIQKLRKSSEEVLALRLKIRDAIRDNERGEKRISELEKMVREQDRKRRD